MKMDNGRGVAILVREVNAKLEKRKPREKIVAYNAGWTKIREIGLTRHPVERRKRPTERYKDVVEVDSFRRVQVRK